MGTNYYLYTNCCDKCGRGDKELHIGKSSMGWCFSLHVIPDEGINSLEDWKKEFLKSGVVIKNEYDEPVSVKEMLDVIENREGKGFDREAPSPYYSSWDDFHTKNHSEVGPKGLLRHQIGQYCLGHGEGTWDLIPGEYS